MNKLIITLLLYGLLNITNANAADILKTDRLFTEKQYSQAKEGYLKAAMLGNPHAYYQLARMYTQGLGVEQDIVNALVYYSLAAEYDYFNAQKVIDDTLAKLPKDSQVAFKQIMADYKKEHGKAVIDGLYFPIIDKSTLNSKVTFDGKASLERTFQSIDFVDDSIAALNNLAIEEGGNENANYMSTPKEPYLILDIDIAADGSIRDYSVVQHLGSSGARLINEFVLYPLPAPSYSGKHVDYVHRVYLGAAGYSKSTMAFEHEQMYSQIIRQARKLKEASSLADRYQYAMALLNFPWLTQEDGEAEQRLLALSIAGHPGAMYEYGMLLYRDQRNIPDAVKWISQSSKYGLARAEYRLAKILLSSPWVEHDEEKALLWFESAMTKGHLPSAIHTIDIKLNATDKSLRDVETAIEYLDLIADKHGNNPEYYYLLGVSFRDREDRDYSLYIRNLRTAISKAKIANWDTTEWENLLERSTQGTVYIIDQ